ncbi:MAG: class I SAM-dependent methyltransferase [Inquilinus sp.]|nr:class I SAM-dependent methyltransferase [Inquilinus sp.]
MTHERLPRQGGEIETTIPNPIVDRPYRPGRAMRWLLTLARNIQVGSLTFVFPDGSKECMTGPEPGPQAVFEVHHERIARRFIIGGTLGFCEAYLDGDWSSPDMETLFVVTLLNEHRLQELLAGRGWYRAVQFLSHAMRRNNRRGAKRNIAYHYDLGNAFYEKWLDPSMTYSSAVFDRPEAGSDLSAAQHRKYQALARRMGLAADHHVLEIGCGWGGFAEFAAGEVGAQVTGITISREQHDFARRRIFEAGLAERVDIRLQDYREVDGQFDRIASIEMFEAVGEAYWPRFFGTLRERLVSGGGAALQIITIADRYFEEYRHKADYIQKYIFPGGMLPSPSELRGQLRTAGLTLREMAGFGGDYAQTLRLWNERFQAAWPEIQPLGFDERFKRMWEQYLHYCAAGFGVGTIDVVQLAVTRD